MSAQLFSRICSDLLCRTAYTLYKPCIVIQKYLNLVSTLSKAFNGLPSSSISTTTLIWVLACSTVVEHSQQEGFTECRWQRHVKPPTWRRIRALERSNFHHERSPASEATPANPAAQGGPMGETWPRKFDESGDFHVTYGFFYMP
jgi:hypothetical protein